MQRYHPYSAEGMALLRSLDHYSYSSGEMYWCHLEVEQEGREVGVVLATTR